MQVDVIKRQLMDALFKVAPELKDEAIDTSVNLQDQLDLDSVDILNYIIQIQKDLHVEIPNQDFPLFLRMDDSIAYLAKQNARSQSGIQQ